MNRKQIICLWVGISTFVLIGLYSLMRPYSIDTPRLCVQWAIVAVITGGLIATFKGSENRKISFSSRGKIPKWVIGASIYTLCTAFGASIAVAILYYVPDWWRNLTKWEIILLCAITVLAGLAGFFILYFLIYSLLYLIKRRYTDLPNDNETER